MLTRFMIITGLMTLILAICFWYDPFLDIVVRPLTGHTTYWLAQDILSRLTHHGLVLNTRGT